MKTIGGIFYCACMQHTLNARRSQAGTSIAIFHGNSSGVQRRKFFVFAGGVTIVNYGQGNQFCFIKSYCSVMCTLLLAFYLKRFGWKPKITTILVRSTIAFFLNICLLYVYYGEQILYEQNRNAYIVTRVQFHWTGARGQTFTRAMKVSRL